MMEVNETDCSILAKETNDEDSRSALNSTVLNYYKKFGRKRDLEQYFSLSTAQSEVKDPSGLFWRKMKSQNDSSDSGERKSASSIDLCRISIKCSVPDASSSQDESQCVNPINNPESPPIISDDVEQTTPRHSDGESEKSYHNISQKSIDPGLDVSMNKPISPTSSVTSQRKLEWDSLADVGYGNEGDRKNSASSLSTLERLALKQQYSNNDNTKCDNVTIGSPTAQSTPMEGLKESKVKGKATKGIPSKSTKINKKDIDVVRVNVPATDNIQAVNVNLTKHISFNVDKKNGNVTENLSQPLEKVSVETEMTPAITCNKEVQTSLPTIENDNFSCRDSATHAGARYGQSVPVIISLNSVKKHYRKKKKHLIMNNKTKRRMNGKKKLNLSCQEKSGGQVSEAESFEYMPGHMYSQNQGENKAEHITIPDNKSSLESSGPVTTGSSKSSTLSFTKDLEKSVEVLNKVLQHCNNSSLKRKVVKDIVLKLIKSKYRDDDTTTDFLSGLTYNSNNMGMSQGDFKNYTTTSTSDMNCSQNSAKHFKSKKSILRKDNFDANIIKNTAQSEPNLHLAISSSMPKDNLMLKNVINSTNSETDSSIKSKKFSEDFKTSSEKLYLKYLEALQRENTYKKHLKEKERFLKQKLVGSELSLKSKIQSNLNIDKLNDLINDLAINNYDNGSGDAGKFEGDLNSLKDNKYDDMMKKQHCHSIFTLSPENSDKQATLNDKHKYNKIKSSLLDNGKNKAHHKASTSKHIEKQLHYYPYNTTNMDVIDKCGPPHEMPDNQLNSQISMTQPLNSLTERHEFKKYYRAVSQESDNVKTNLSPLSYTIVNAPQDTHSITKCTQTDLSINPKVSSPTVSDVNIVTDVHVTEVQEGPYENTSNVTNYENLCQSNNSNESKEYECESKDYIGSNEPTVKNIVCDDYINFIVGNENETNNCTALKDLKYKHTMPENKYTISLNGTNMALTVQTEEITKQTKGSDNINNKVDRSACTDDIQYSEKGTSLQNEFSIAAVQFGGTNSINMKTSIQSKTCSLPLNDTNKNINNPTNKVSSPRSLMRNNHNKGAAVPQKENVLQNKNVNSPLKKNQKEIKRSNTLPLKTAIKQSNIISPKTEINRKKPFVKTNTETENLASSSNSLSKENITKQELYRVAIPECNKESKDNTNKTEKKTTLDEIGDCKSKEELISKQFIQQKTVLGSDKSTRDSDDTCGSRDPIIELIKDITHRYTKCNFEKKMRNKCFKEIMSILHYLVDTEESGTTDYDQLKTSNSTITDNSSRKKFRDCRTVTSPRKCFVNKGIQSNSEGTCLNENKSPEVPLSIAESSSESPALLLLEKIKKECEKYKKRTKNSNKTEESSSSTVTWEKRTSKKLHRCKNRRTSKPDKCKNKPIAYNLILETSDSVVSEEVFLEQYRPRLRNIVVKVPSKCKNSYNLQTNENIVGQEKVKEKLIRTPNRSYIKVNRSRSLPNDGELSSEGDLLKKQELTVRDYLEINRPDFMESSGKRLNLLSDINKTRMNLQESNRPNKLKTLPVHHPLYYFGFCNMCSRGVVPINFCQCGDPYCVEIQNEVRRIANERTEYRKLLSLQLEREQCGNSISLSQLQQMAKDHEVRLKKNNIAPKFISEKQMKQHSEKIYKTLPEVVLKKEELKKERIKKTNLIMASLFNKNLQRNTLRGAVNLSNYNHVIKI